LCAVERAAQQLDADLKPVFPGPAPQCIERILEVARGREPAAEVGGERATVR
jgi:hypothetical protein